MVARVKRREANQANSIARVSLFHDTSKIRMFLLFPLELSAGWNGGSAETLAGLPNGITLEGISSTAHGMGEKVQVN